MSARLDVNAFRVPVAELLSEEVFDMIYQKLFENMEGSRIELTKDEFKVIWVYAFQLGWRMKEESDKQQEEG